MEWGILRGTVESFSARDQTMNQQAKRGKRRQMRAGGVCETETTRKKRGVGVSSPFLCFFVGIDFSVSGQVRWQTAGNKQLTDTKTKRAPKGPHPLPLNPKVHELSIWPLKLEEFLIYDFKILLICLHALFNKLIYFLKFIRKEFITLIVFDNKYY